MHSVAEVARHKFNIAFPEISEMAVPMETGTVSY
ncbi:hypothetical protein AGROH133_06213 [Agrobacterium tumefaciens]|nr:hypothetical protein AGROH133_06213 [Agrobacterium tumefaciens]